MEKLDKKTYRGIVKFTLESMLNLSKTDKNYNLAADTIYYYPMRRKTPCFSYGDIRRVHRIYASN
jgi:hypothetical protein